MLDYMLFPEQRQALIKDRLMKHGRVQCILLAKELKVSEHTIRRDLQELALSGICKRVYGGAVSQTPVSEDFSHRISQNEHSKQRLAQATIPLLTHNRCLFIDSGSTNLAIAQMIPADITLTVVTNSPDIAQIVMRIANKQVILIGGQINSCTGGATGITALQQLNTIFIDQCILGGCALDVDEGLTAFNYEDSEFKRALIQRSAQVMVALTSPKIPTVANYQVARCQDIDTLIIEHDLAEDKIQPFYERINIIIRAK